MSGTQITHTLARSRSRYLGEKYPTARHVIGTNSSAMIDECTPGQLALRAQLALFTLNRGIFDSSIFSDTDLTGLVSYTLTISPRRGDLVIVSDAPANIVGRLMTSPLGLRYVGSATTREENQVYRMVHGSSGAFITSTSHRGTLAGVRIEVGDEAPRTRWKTTDKPLSEREVESTDYVDALDEDVRRLLAGVFVRLGASDQRTWAVGQYFEDPLEREPAEWWPDLGSGRTRRMLTGSGFRWELRWTGPPFPSDVVRALTDRHCGLKGVTVIRDDDGFEYELSFGRARLLVRPA